MVTRRLVSGQGHQQKLVLVFDLEGLTVWSVGVIVHFPPPSILESKVVGPKVLVFPQDTMREMDLAHTTPVFPPKPSQEQHFSMFRKVAWSPHCSREGVAVGL